jgi:four helix bundle protein
MGTKGHKDLIVWQKAMDVVVLTYKLTKGFPEAEKFGLVSQMRRAAVSIPSNIAEGRKRGGETEFKQFLRIAFGSAAELETQIDISERLEFVNINATKNIKEALNEVMRMLNVMTSH